MNLPAAIRRYRIRRLRRQLTRSLDRHRELRDEARCEAAFARGLETRIERLEAESWAWTTTGVRS